MSNHLHDRAREQAMPSYPSLTTRVIGQAEKALNAILHRELAETGLTESQWVILTLAVTGGTADRDLFSRQVAGALKITETAAGAHIAEMITARQLQAAGDGTRVTVSSAARQLHGRIRGIVTEITGRLWGDLAPEDLATAGRVLTIITGRADAELTR
jgi:DNA-binding MarR family transcriptional regulator